MAAPSTLPKVPAKHADFVPYIKSNPNKPLPQLLEPYKQYDAKLREVFAQEPDHPALADHHLNLVPVFEGHQEHVSIHARDLEAESVEEKDKYVMPLKEADRRPNASPAIVQSLHDFHHNFSLFCESSLVDLDWSNVVAAGSSVVTCLLPVPSKHNKSKRTLRHYYHETIAPASDVDLFIYGLSEQDAIKKMIEIEQRVKDSILTETTTIRTKNAISIVSQYPTRHIQIVLRVYKSVAEILTGFDVDCSCAAYDGEQVWAAPRALTAFMTQANTVDLTRRSPSYENRLSKYSHRGFEIYVPGLNRARIDPTIFERNFARTVGLARLLVLERLPTKSDRESYMDERRRERGRPPVNRNFRNFSHSNIKDRHEDEVAEWVDQEDVSDYHTFTIPYGPKYHAKKIEKLLYTKDLLLNAEWNRKDNREANLHRHPAFFGYAEDVIHDCCGFCPKPTTLEEHDVAEEESKLYVSGDISFIKDDPGRQAIGSFHPLTDDDWTEMAYVGNTARLCQAIVDGDLEHVEDWLSQEDSDPNCRDYTGRTPLHLAVISSTPEIVQALINHGARLVARLADGRTALHLAAARGSVEIVRMILQKSEENEEESSRKEDLRKKARIAVRQKNGGPDDANRETPGSGAEETDLELVGKEDLSDTGAHSATTGSFIKVTDSDKKSQELIPEEDDVDDPDVYDVNVLAWDTQCSPLHYAILNGHIEVVRELVQNFGADVLLPVKLLDPYSKSPRGAILTLVLALRLPLEVAKAMAKTLLELGASSSQADMYQTTALHYVSNEEPKLLQTLFDCDEPAAKRAINHLCVEGSSYYSSAHSPLMSSIMKGDALAAFKLLDAGAEPNIEFKDWMKSIEAQFSDFSKKDSSSNHRTYVTSIEQPIVLAVHSELPELVHQLLDCGVSPNTLTKHAQTALLNSFHRRIYRRESLLDLVRRKIHDLRTLWDSKPPRKPERILNDDTNYLAEIEPGTYKYFIANIQLEEARNSDQYKMKRYEDQLKAYHEIKGRTEKKEALDALAADFEAVEQNLLAKDAKTFKELHPEIKEPDEARHSSRDEHVPAPWEIAFDFHVHNLTTETREAYLKLFQAAWDGNLGLIKSLTLGPWGPMDNAPLKIAVEDNHDQSPFSVAVLRGHFGVARAIVEICHAQYHPDEERLKTRYRMGTGDEMDDHVTNSSEFPVYQEIVDDKFTIENIGEVSVQVKSEVSPLSFIDWKYSTWDYNKFFCGDRKFTYGLNDTLEIKPRRHEDFVKWSIFTNDKKLFSFMLDLKLEYTDKLANRLDGSAGIPSFPRSDFLLAITYGRLELLAEMIKHGGVGIKLESLVKQSGVKYREKPRYYQGLSVHGRKRQDWVSAARGTYRSKTMNDSPPLLHAAFNGSLQSVEWFLSDTPARHYRDFGEAYKHEKLIKHLNSAASGFDKVVRTWLSARRELTLHCAIMAKPRPEALKLIEYLIKVMPNALEVKSRHKGYTPLALAFSLRRLDAAKILVEAGADQTVRDSNGANILHLLLHSTWNSYAPSKEELPLFLQLIDKRLVSSLLSERASYSPGSLTPIANWLRGSKEDEDTLRVLLEFAKSTNNDHLELLNGAGDTPLHYVVSAMKQKYLKMLLEYRPDLLYRENSVGRTPYELAEDAYTSTCTSNAPTIATLSSHTSIVELPTESFVSDEVNHDDRVTVKSVWRVCNTFKRQHPKKRKLVSLLDANEVAKRLSKRHAGRGYNIDNDSDSDVESDDGKNEDVADEVSWWYHIAANH